MVCAACKETVQHNPQTLTYQEVTDKLAENNKQFVIKENAQIDGYVERRKLNAVKTGTGLRYAIYEKGDTTLSTVKNGMVAVIDYTVLLLNGDTCYTTNGKKPQQFTVGHQDVESGLHEGIQYLRVGDKAKLIIPSYLAHGLLGDLDKIPPRHTIVYDLHVLNAQ